MATHKEILARWPSLRSISEDTGASLHQVRKWDNRNSTPCSHWQRLINSARRRGIALKVTELMEAAAKGAEK